VFVVILVPLQPYRSLHERLAPGWHQQALLRRYMDWIEDKEQPRDAASIELRKAA
jgi:hypothetical protein